MAALDGFQIVGTTADEGGERPVMCSKEFGKYRVQMSWIDEHEQGPDATKATWEIEVDEWDHGVGGSWKTRLVHVALHATDALRIAKGVVHFHRALTQTAPA
jgi:hypothetical protein